MASYKSKTVNRLEAEIRPQAEDLDNSLRVACDKYHCHYKIATTRDLSKQLGGYVPGLTVDTRSIRFKWGGWRWEGMTPKRVADGLKHLDGWDRKGRRRGQLLNRRLLLRPFTLVVEKVGKVHPMTEAAKKRLRKMDSERDEAGVTEKRYRASLHARVVGY